MRAKRVKPNILGRVVKRQDLPSLELGRDHLSGVRSAESLAGLDSYDKAGHGDQRGRLSGTPKRLPELPGQAA